MMNDRMKKFLWKRSYVKLAESNENILTFKVAMVRDNSSELENFLITEE